MCYIDNKVKLVPFHIIKAYGGVEIQLHTFLTSELHSDCTVLTVITSVGSDPPGV